MRLHTASRLHRLIRFLEVRGRLRCQMAAAKQGAFVAHPPLEIPGKGTFAIYVQGDVDHDLWQL
jgi:hypothetical protein